MSEIFEIEFDNFERVFSKIIRALGLKEILKEKKRIILKPNLTTDICYPVTTDPEFVENLIRKFSEFYKGEILIAEGSGGCETKLAFEKLGYEKLSKKFKINLVDLNLAQRVKLREKRALRLKEVWFPKILLDSYLISLPVPKEHSSAIFTCGLKNQFGVYLSKDSVKEYDKEKLEKIKIFVAKKLKEGGWNKRELHSLGVEEAIFDLNLYKKPDLVICDGRVGIRGGELGGKEFKIGKVFASFDPVALDSYLAKIFGFDWKKIRYLVLANKILGEAENYKVIKL